MAKPASKTLIGGFVVGALALLIVALVVFGSGKFLQKRYPFVLFFEGSVSGLNVGAPVVFRGVKVGSVSRIVLQGDPKTAAVRIPVYIDFDPENFQPIDGKIGGYQRDPYAKLKTFVDAGLRGQLQTQSFLTGQLLVALDYFPDSVPRLVGGGDVPEIPTVPTKLEQIQKTLEKLPLEELVHSIASAAEGIENLVRGPELKASMVAIRKTAENAEQAVNRLAQAGEETLQSYNLLAKDAKGEIGALSAKVKSTVDDYGRLARDLDGEIGPLTKHIDATLQTAKIAIGEAEKALANAEKLTSPASPVMQSVIKTLDELNQAARSIRMLAELLERHPESLIQGKGGPKGR